MRILASSLNWNVNGPTRDPAGGAADPITDGQRQYQHPELQRIDRPGQGLEPAIVERRGQHEHDRGDARPHEPAGERRPRIQWRAAALDAVGERHREAGRGEQHRVDRELDVVRAPGRPDGLGRPIGDADRLGSDDAHQSFV